ncbi:Carbon monoxide dehydrogenase medium chain [Nymphon striatum]|nr:Carbon monoxide dehydrogenase medium chain [Nymphon striatum]
MYNFDMERPTSIADATAALGAEDAQALGGGQTLIPTLKQRLASPSKLVSLSGIPEMQGVCTNDAGELCIGGATTHGTVAEQASAYPALAALAANIGDPAVRNRGTIGLFTTALDEGEIITEVRFPVPQAANYQKFEQPASRFALVGVFVAKTADGVRVAVTGASEDGVFRWTAAEDALAGNFSASAIEGLAPAADGMIGDLHGTPAYRAHLVGVMTRRAVEAAK